LEHIFPQQNGFARGLPPFFSAVFLFGSSLEVWKAKGWMGWKKQADGKDLLASGGSQVSASAGLGDRRGFTIFGFWKRQPCVPGGLI